MPIFGHILHSFPDPQIMMSCFLLFLSSPILLVHVLACKFEFRWKNVSRKMTRKRNLKDEDGLHLVLQENEKFTWNLTGNYHSPDAYFPHFRKEETERLLEIIHSFVTTYDKVKRSANTSFDNVCIKLCVKPGAHFDV